MSSTQSGQQLVYRPQKICVIQRPPASPGKVRHAMSFAARSVRPKSCTRHVTRVKERPCERTPLDRGNFALAPGALDLLVLGQPQIVREQGPGLAGVDDVVDVAESGGAEDVDVRADRVGQLLLHLVGRLVRGD